MVLVENEALTPGRLGKAALRNSSMVKLLMVLAAGALSGCGGKDNPTSPSAPTGGMPRDFYALWDSSFVDGAYFFTTGMDTMRQLVTMDVDGVSMAAVLLRVGDRYVDGGTVRAGQSPPVAGAVDTLARRSVPVNGTSWHLYTSVPKLPTPPPINFDGVAWHHFQLSGSPDFGAFKDSILSVTRPVISAPAEGAIVPRDEDLIVSWSNPGADPSVHVSGFVVSNVNGDIGPGVGDARDPDGHARVVFSYTHLPAGSARLTVVKYRIVRRVNGPLTLDLKCEAIVRRNLTLE